jgi:hypothetical protein
MTALKEKAIEMINKLPDSKIPPVMLFLENLSTVKREEKQERARKAYLEIERLRKDAPPGFDEEKELAEALEEKHGPFV